MDKMPHAHFMMALTLLVLTAFVAVSYWVLFFSEDVALKGSIIQSWNNLGVGAVGFWLGSSLAGKIKGFSNDSNFNNTSFETRSASTVRKDDGSGNDPVVERVTGVSVTKPVQQTTTEPDSESGTNRPHD